MSASTALIAKSVARFKLLKLEILAEASCLPGGGIAEREEYEQWARRFVKLWVSDLARSQIIAML